MSHIPEGVYRIENIAFDSDSHKRVLDLKGSAPMPGTPILCYYDHKSDNQKVRLCIYSFIISTLIDSMNLQWRVTRFKQGYSFQAVDPRSNIFVEKIRPVSSLNSALSDLQLTCILQGEQVAGSPIQQTAFKLFSFRERDQY